MLIFLVNQLFIHNFRVLDANIMNKKIFYVRVSSVIQNTDRQRINEKEYDHIVEDRCSGSIAFFERPGGKEILKLVNKTAINSLSVLSLDRLGRNLKDILNTIEFFNEKKIPIHFVSQGLTTLDEFGNENAIAKLMIGVLGTVAEMERNQLRERQLSGINIAKLKGNVYMGRRKGTSEDTLQFLTKPKNKQALDYIKKGYPLNEISKIVGIHANTLTKIKKLGLKDI
jgi:DNA invertase Pin-like site-specific DNA recombinase